MKRILVPTDFSATAERAFRFAADIASKTGGSITLYHVYTPEEIPFADTEEKRKEYNKQLEATQLKRLQRLKKKVMADGKEVIVTTTVGRAPIIGDVLKYTKHNQIDLIVMGTQGASGLKKIIVGSVATHIIEKSDIPVLLVPEKFEWKDPEHIVFATDYRKTDTRALSLTIAMAKIYHAAVTIVHLLNPYSQLIDKPQPDFNDYAYALQRTFNDYDLKFKELKTTTITDTMENLQKEIPFDMLVMVRRKKFFLEKFFTKNFTRNMACITTHPLLVVPEE
jgi:nucleotide-binding universal stress UspA family protein